MNQLLNICCDYIRLVSYGLIISSCIVKFVAREKIRKVLLFGDIIVALALLLSNFHTLIGKNPEIFRDYVITPAVFIWAVIHFITLIKGEPLDKIDTK